MGPGEYSTCIQLARARKEQSEPIAHEAMEAFISPAKG